MFGTWFLLFGIWSIVTIVAVVSKIKNTVAGNKNGSRVQAATSTISLGLFITWLFWVGPFSLFWALFIGGVTTLVLSPLLFRSVKYYRPRLNSHRSRPRHRR